MRGGLQGEDKACFVGGRSSLYWWLYPSRVAFFLLIPIYLGCIAFTASDYALYKQYEVFLTAGPIWLGLAGLVVFALSSFCAEFGIRHRPTPLLFDSGTLRAILAGLYVATLIAYAIFLFPILFNPQLIAELYGGSIGAMAELRETLTRIPGVTSLMTLQSLCVVLHVAYRRVTGSRLPYVYHLLLAAVVVFCLLRAWLWSERLALIELAIPAALVAIGYPGRPRKPLLAAAPALGFLVIFGLFCAGEYFRSWQFYRAYWDDSFFAFAWARFIGYYATALNNGAMLLSTTEPGYLPFFTAPWYYSLPGRQLLEAPAAMAPGASIDAMPPIEALAHLLNAHANPEFNNPSGLFMPFVDFGPVGGLLCWMLLGTACGLLFRSFANLRAHGLILFPVWYVGILEILRLLYWSEPRFFPVLAVACLLAVYFELKASQSRRLGAARRLVSRPQ